MKVKVDITEDELGAMDSNRLQKITSYLHGLIQQYAADPKRKEMFTQALVRLENLK